MRLTVPADAGAPGAPDRVLFVLGIEPAEREVLLTIGDLVLALLASEPGAARPTDPALLRLLPDVVADPAEAADLRRLSHDDVRRTKADHLRTLRRVALAAEPDVAVTAADAPGLTQALSHVRLVLAERLGIVTDEDSAALDHEIATGAADRDRTYLGTVWQMLGALQGAVVERLIADLDARPAPGDGGTRGVGDA